MKRSRAMGRQQEESPEYFARTRLPRGKECFGIVEQRLGGSRMSVRCLDGKTRNCRIPGRLKKNLWVRDGDVVIIEPWELLGDEKGDVVYKYRVNQVQYLKQKGYLKALADIEEF
ncbi:MAG: translation initiation factor eIF-1A [Nanoarchaeota archaeon]|nr:translation initiation factor eIF-1A [Nanoarchaeota archaeon]